MKNISDIFFDLDHTLWDFDKNSGLAFERVFKKHSIAVGVQDFLAIYEPINLRYWKAYREERVSKQELRRGRLKDAFTAFNIQPSINELDALAVSYIDELPLDNFLFEGTVEILEYLHQKYTLHIITNGFQEVQHKKLSNSGISKYFKTVTTSEEVGVKKPNKLVFEHALDKAKCLPENSLMIGDSFEADILGAEALGMHTIFFNLRNETIPSTYTQVNNLNELFDHFT